MSRTMQLRISDKELEVLECICEGLTTKQIGVKISRSDKTVEAHITSIMAKTGIHNKVTLALWAIKHEYVSLHRLELPSSLKALVHEEEHY